MDLRELKRIIRLVETSAIEELEVEEQGTRIRIRKGGGVTQTFLADRFLPAPAGYPYDPGRQGGLGESQEAGAAPAKASASEAAEVPEPAKTVNSPMVGTFYRANSPESPPFVQIGSIVDPETVVCILEAMKVMNEIKAGCSGKISEVLVENTSPVEFGQPLFKVVPA
jgi:acetyl-CoA carboxylase biotin carboxyl carrier protein